MNNFFFFLGWLSAVIGIIIVHLFLADPHIQDLQSCQKMNSSLANQLQLVQPKVYR